MTTEHKNRGHIPPRPMPNPRPATDKPFVDQQREGRRINLKYFTKRIADAIVRAMQ